MPWDRCRRDKVDSASSCPCFEGLHGPWNFVCFLVNHSRTHKYQEISKSINPLITIYVFNDFLIQSHTCSCMFLVWTLIYGFALMNLLSNLLNSFWVQTYELQNVSSGFLSFWWLYFVLNILMFFNTLKPYEGCLFISFKNYLKHINERSFVLTNKMILSLNLKSKRIFLYIWFIIACNWWVKPQVHGFTDVVKREYRSNRELFNLINF